MRSGYMSSEQRISHLLAREETELVTRLLGHRCQALAMGIAQLFLTDGPDHSTWRKHDVGVLCLVKDSQRRSYFFRLYCVIRRQMVWEHEVYNSLDYQSPKPFLHTFEAEEGIAAFNFASEEEAYAVRTALLEKLEAKKQRRLERRNRHSASGMNQHPHSQISSNSGIDSDIANGTVSTVPKPRQQITSGAGRRKERDSKRRLTKADIGLPQHFRHISHVGWDPNKGFDLDNVEDPQLKQFFVKAGVSDSQLQDKETREFIYDFINRHGGIDAVKEEFVYPTATHGQPTSVPPPVPARTTPSSTSAYPYQTRSAPPPPPPPSRTGPLPPPPPPSQPPATAGPPPPTQSRPPQNIPGPQTTGIPAPPPAPPVAVNAPPPPPPPPSFPICDSASTTSVTSSISSTTSVGQPDTRSALMDAIRSGTSLKHVEVENKRTSGGDTRGELLDQIRQGVELKSVQQKAKPAPSSTPQNGLAGALARALAERSRVIHSDSSASSDDDEEDDEWED
ncbi:actin nucleation-promoting factor WASL isoform X2 [Anabrus simplex]|uniref:actin nucleation-promoting factor WASL isoform X2 n=1 Tax=Anabrus simplex TaxID=316456 RepID=UPI0034DCD645